MMTTYTIFSVNYRNEESIACMTQDAVVASRQWRRLVRNANLAKVRGYKGYIGSTFYEDFETRVQEIINYTIGLTGTETVLEVRGTLRSVLCMNEDGSIALYRIETLPGIAPYRHRVTYWQEQASILLNDIDTVLM